MVVEIDSAMVAAGLVEIELRSESFQPSAHGGGDDHRELGVVLLGVDFQPDSPTEGWWD